MTPQEILKKAADRFEENQNSWIKGIYFGHADKRMITPPTPKEKNLIDRAKMPEVVCFCAVGMIYHFAETMEEAKATFRHMAEHLNRIFPHAYDNDSFEGVIIEWNDQHHQVTNIIQGMREAAKS